MKLVENNGFMPTEDAQDNTRMWLTAEEAAEILRVHLTTVHSMCRRGELIALKVGRDWRISARGLDEKATHGDVHYKLVVETAELSAEKTATRVLAVISEALTRELSRQESKHKLSA